MGKKKQESNPAQPFIDAIRKAYWDREKFNPVWSILETFEALEMVNSKGEKPLLCKDKKHFYKTLQGWHLEFALPPAIGYKDVLKNVDYFQEQSDSLIELEPHGKYLHMEVITVKLSRKVPYQWDPAKYPKMALPFPVGVTAIGSTAVADLAEMPHMLIGGNPGSGKTTFLQILLMSLIKLGGVFPVVIDLKGVDYGDFEDYSLIVDDEIGAFEILAALNQEMDRRIRIFKSYKPRIKKLQRYPGNDLPWIVAIVDELGELRDKKMQEMLNRLARLSRATGICLVVATQRPSHTLYKNFTDTRMLFSGRLCFSVPAPEDSQLILKSDAASKILPGTPGRGIWQWDRQQLVQGMYLAEEEIIKMLGSIPPGGMSGAVAKVELQPEKLLPR